MFHLHGLRRRAPGHELDEQVATRLGRTRLRRQFLRVSSHRCVGQPVDVRKDRFRQPVQHHRLDSGSLATRDDVPPRDSSPHSIRRLQRVDGAALADLQPAQREVDTQVGDVRASHHNIDEAIERHRDAFSNGVQKGGVLRPRIFGDLRADRVDHVVGRLRQSPLQKIHHVLGERVPWPDGRAACRRLAGRVELVVHRADSGTHRGAGIDGQMVSSSSKKAPNPAARWMKCTSRIQCSRRPSASSRRMGRSCPA